MIRVTSHWKHQCPSFDAYVTWFPFLPHWSACSMGLIGANVHLALLTCSVAFLWPVAPAILHILVLGSVD